MSIYAYGKSSLLILEFYTLVYESDWKMVNKNYQQSWHGAPNRLSKVWQFPETVWPFLSCIYSLATIIRDPQPQSSHTDIYEFKQIQCQTSVLVCSTTVCFKYIKGFQRSSKVSACVRESSKVQLFAFILPSCYRLKPYLAVKWTISPFDYLAKTLAMFIFPNQSVFNKHLHLTY